MQTRSTDGIGGCLLPSVLRADLSLCVLAAFGLLTASCASNGPPESDGNAQTDAADVMQSNADASIDDGSAGDARVNDGSPTDGVVHTDGARSDGTAPADGSGAPDVTPPPQPLCPTGSAWNGAGGYCGNNGLTNADANTLYQCANAGQPPTSAQPCANGCTHAPAGTNDYCASAGTCNLAAFMSQYSNQCTGYPGWSPSGQCTDLALRWVAFLGLPVQFSGNAIQWAGKNVQGFTWIQNNANNPNLVPSPGDIVVWNSGEGVTSTYGHVDIAVSAPPGGSTWSSFDQNWCSCGCTIGCPCECGGCYPKMVTHYWAQDDVIGWEHPNMCP